MPSLTAEASTATVTKSCLEKFQQCIQQLQGKDRIQFRTRLADLRLWSDSVGAAASAKASLDWRFQHRPNDIDFIQGLLSMLEGLLQECLTAASDGSDVRDAIINIDSTVDSLAFIGVQIRRSGRKSRLRKADNSFNENREKYRKLRAHLACVLTTKPTEEGRPENEGKEIHSVDYFADMKLPPVQERLVEANLRRRHRFMEAQRHSHGLKDPSATASHTVISQQFITMAATDTQQHVSLVQDINVVAALRQEQDGPPGTGESTPTIPTTSASGLESKWGGLQNDRRAGSTVTRLTAITAAARYPRAHPSSSQGQKLVKCPCCCQAIPTSELEDSQLRKHVANDLCPYTCILEDCPTPYTLFVTRKEWNEHAMNDHPPHWQCPCCEGDPPTFKSLSEMTIHIVSEHPEALSDGLEELLSIAEINIMGITKCPLCESEGPQDSPEIIEHVFQHVHSFSLRSLPWPMDPAFNLEKPVGIFDMNRAFKMTKGDNDEEYFFRIDDWAENGAPAFDLEKGEKTVIDDKGEKLVFGIAGWPEDRTLERDQSLQLCDIDRNPPKPSEEELAAVAQSKTDYFAQNDYFIDESGDGRFPSQTSHSSQTRNSIKYSVRQGPKKWVCTICGVQSIEGDDAYYQHLEYSHTADMEEADTDAELWKFSMLYNAYLNGEDFLMERLQINGLRIIQRVLVLTYNSLDTRTPSIADSSLLKNLAFKSEDSDMTAKIQHDSDFEHFVHFDKLEPAEVMLRQSLATGKKVLGKEHLDTPISMDNLARMKVMQGKYKVAEGMYRQTLEMTKRLIGEGHPDTLMRLNNLAQVLAVQGKYLEAEDIHRRTLAMRTKVLGKEHSDTLASMGSLAQVLGRQGVYLEAEDIHRRTLAMRTKVLGKEHSDTLASMDSLAQVQGWQGKYLEAEEIHRQTLATREKVLGKEHRDTLTSMENLAQGLGWQGKYLAAEEMLRQTLATREKLLGEEHPDTLVSMDNLALGLCWQGKYVEAEAIYRQTLATRKKILGEGHPDTLISINNLAQVLSM